MAGTALLAVAVSAGVAEAAPAGGSAGARVAWRPHVRSAIAYARHRRGDISFAVRSDGRVYGYRPQRTAPSASVLKAMLLVAYLDRRAVRRRRLGPADRRLLGPMIRRSDNAAATRVLGIVGEGGLVALARRVGMRRFRPAAPIWGNSRIDAADQTRFFLHIDRYVVHRHRAAAMRLLASVIPRQRWGIARVVPRGWRIYFKGGWGSGTGAVDNQVALLRRGHQRVAVAILTTADGSHAYGKATLRAIARRLLRGLARAPRGRGRRPGPGPGTAPGSSPGPAMEIGRGH
ncbi:MAG TPA: serine hydrolase [Solirubrobacteraceae bacterium]|nr:serine hydrolase [Solirubrobacteraceae bacterium]